MISHLIDDDEKHIALKKENELFSDFLQQLRISRLSNFCFITVCDF